MAATDESVRHHLETWPPSLMVHEPDRQAGPEYDLKVTLVLRGKPAVSSASPYSRRRYPRTERCHLPRYAANSGWAAVTRQPGIATAAPKPARSVHSWTDSSVDASNSIHGSIRRNKWLKCCSSTFLVGT